MEPMVFRSRYLGGALAVIFSPLVVAFGLYVSPVEPAIGLLSSLLGVLVGICGCGYLLRRVVVDETGIRVSPRWFGGFRVAWGDIESWSVRALDPIENPNGSKILKLQRRGRFWTADVAAYEASQPGFDVLIACVRARLGDREKAEPVSSADAEHG